MIKPISWIDPLSRKDFTLYVEAMSLISLIWSEVDLAETRINGKTAMEKPDFKIFYDLCHNLACLFCVGIFSWSFFDGNTFFDQSLQIVKFIELEEEEYSPYSGFGGQTDLIICNRGFLSVLKRSLGADFQIEN